MEKKYYDYFNNLGINIDADTHPFSREYQSIKKLNNPNFNKCFEHLLLTLIFDIEIIKRYNKSDYEEYINKLKKEDISFWGERFEIYWYSSLLHRLSRPVKNLKRGIPGEEADFVFEFEGRKLTIETTSVTYSELSNKSNPIAKIKSKINEKESSEYVDLNCCLILDITNLSFYRKLLNNFSQTISNLLDNLSSGFGAILLNESFHTDINNNPRYITQVYEWINPYAGTCLKKFIELSKRGAENEGKEKLFFKIN